MWKVHNSLCLARGPRILRKSIVLSLEHTYESIKGCCFAYFETKLDDRSVARVVPSTDTLYTRSERLLSRYRVMDKSIIRSMLSDSMGKDFYLPRKTWARYKDELEKL